MNGEPLTLPILTFFLRCFFPPLGKCPRSISNCHRCARANDAEHATLVFDIKPAEHVYTWEISVFLVRIGRLHCTTFAPLPPFLSLAEINSQRRPLRPRRIFYSAASRCASARFSRVHFRHYGVYGGGGRGGVEWK